MSVILSGSAPDQSMSYPDYDQTPHDHSALLVVVRHIGMLIHYEVYKSLTISISTSTNKLFVGRQLRTKQFNRAFERISRVSSVKLHDSQGNPRQIWIRYLRGYPGENNDWGDFQTHRKALGLISVGQCNSQEEFNELCRIHESLKVGYAFTLYDSRCILFGLNPDGTLYEGSHSSDVSPCVDGDDDVVHHPASAFNKVSNVGPDSNFHDPDPTRQSSSAGMSSEGIGTGAESLASDDASLSSSLSLPSAVRLFIHNMFYNAISSVSKH